MLKSFKITPNHPTVDDVINASGKHATAESCVTYIDITLEASLLGNGTPTEQLHHIRGYIADNASSFLKAFNEAAAVTVVGIPVKINAKVYPEITICVRAEDADHAVKSLSKEKWCSKVRKMGSYRLDETFQR